VNGPNRGSYAFRQNWQYDATGQNKAETLDHMHAALEALDTHIKAGRIRHVGVSNESAWGTTKWTEIAAQHNLPKMQTIQNEYSLLHRLFDTDLAEVSHNEQVDLICYSPLATGLLTGKYQNGAIPSGSRADLVPGLGGRLKDRALLAVEAYAGVAQKHGLDLTQMAIAWAAARPFMGSVIFGSTTNEQLKQILGAADMTLSKEVMSDINKVHMAHPMPY